MKSLSLAIAAYFGGGVYLAAAADPVTFIEVAKTWGLFAALTLFFIWQSHVREKSLVATIVAVEKKHDSLEKEFRETTQDLLSSAAEAIKENKAVLERVLEKL